MPAELRQRAHKYKGDQDLPRVMLKWPLTPRHLRCIQITELPKAIDSLLNGHDVTDCDAMQGAVRIMRCKHDREFFREEGLNGIPASVRHRRVDAVFANPIFGLAFFLGGRVTSALFVGIHPIPNTIKGRGQFSIKDRPSPSSICSRRFSHRALPAAFIRVSVPVSRH